MLRINRDQHLIIQEKYVIFPNYVIFVRAHWSRRRKLTLQILHERGNLLFLLEKLLSDSAGIARIANINLDSQFERRLREELINTLDSRMEAHGTHGTSEI